jgi:hypothetical protein
MYKQLEAPKCLRSCVVAHLAHAGPALSVSRVNFFFTLIKSAHDFWKYIFGWLKKPSKIILLKCMWGCKKKAHVSWGFRTLLLGLVCGTSPNSKENGDLLFRIPGYPLSPPKMTLIPHRHLESEHFSHSK